MKCPVITSNEGISYCPLAEKEARENKRLRGALENIHFHVRRHFSRFQTQDCSPREIELQEMIMRPVRDMVKNALEEKE